MPGINNRVICKFVKILLFKTVTSTLLTCGCESWKIYLSVSLKKRRPSEIFRKKYLKANIWRENGM